MKCYTCGGEVPKGRRKYCRFKCHAEDKLRQQKYRQSEDVGTIDDAGEPTAEYVAEIERRKAEMRTLVYGDGPPRGYRVECETTVVDARIFEGLPGWF